jgi:hypothetical protein
VADALGAGRAAFAGQAWADAYTRLSAADQAAPLQPDDLERLAAAAYLVGREDESAEVWARAHHQRLARGEAGRAARCAFWLAFGLLNRGEVARGGGWVARARRVLGPGQPVPLQPQRVPGLAQTLCPCTNCQDLHLAQISQYSGVWVVDAASTATSGSSTTKPSG